MKIPRSVVNIVFILSLAAFCLGLFLHSLTYLGIDPRGRVPITWYTFQIVTALALIPIVIVNLRQFARHEPPAKRHDRFQIAVGFAFTIFAFYLVFTFLFTGIVLLHEASPEIVNGNYALAAHGFSQTITKEEFFKYSAYEARMNSSTGWPCAR